MRFIFHMSSATVGMASDLKSKGLVIVEYFCLNCTLLEMLEVHVQATLTVLE